MDDRNSKQLAADIAANVVKSTAISTARDLQIQKLEINYQAMFEQNAKEHGELKDTLVILTEKLDTMIEKMDKKYAGKWVEKVMWSLGGIIGTVIVIALLKEIMK